MIVLGEQVKKEHYVEVKGLKEVRPGRKLMCRKVTFVQDHNNENDHDVQTKTLLFIHGSCAASAQYDSLLEHLAMKQSEEKKTKFVCYLYDQLGCGESIHPPNDWYAYSSSELGQDLLSITESIIDSINETNSSLYIVGHSHGVSQSIKLINAIEDKEQSNGSNSISNKIDGTILIGGGLKDSQCDVVNDGGHWIFTYMPIFLLNRMQPSLSEGFVNAAFHPSTSDKMKEAALVQSNCNDMAMCKAFYRQQQYADSLEAMSFKVRFAFLFHRILGFCLPFTTCSSVPMFVTFLLSLL